MSRRSRQNSVPEAASPAPSQSSADSLPQEIRLKPEAGTPPVIEIRGAREHNLQDVSLTLPKNRLIVMTGVSGSGKSSLAFDTLYAEGQRRYVESLSSYARQFLGQMPKPEVDSITGLAPSISIQQKTSGRNPRSTVGTITEVYDYLRVLFARVGQQNCPQCGRPISAQSPEQIIDTVAQLPAGLKYQILAPVIQGQKGEYRDLFEDLLRQGFVRARVDGRIAALSDDLKLDKQMRHSIEVVIDRLVAGQSARARLAEAVELALRLGKGRLIVSPAEDRNALAESSRDQNEGDEDASSDRGDRTGLDVLDRLFSSDYACTTCGLSFDPPSPQLFSFNSPQGMCLDCNGLGERFEFVIESLVEDPDKSLWTGALNLLGPLKTAGKWRRHIYVGVARAIEEDLQLRADTVLKTAWCELSEEVRQRLLYGTGDRHITFEWRYSGGLWKHGGTFKGLIPELLEGYRKTGNPMRRKQLEKHMRFVNCTTCHGTRLNRQAAAVTVTSSSPAFLQRQAGQATLSDAAADSSLSRGATELRHRLAVHEEPASAPRSSAKKKAARRTVPEAVAAPQSVSLSLVDVCRLDIQSAHDFFESLVLAPTQQFIAEEVLKEIRGRLGFLLRCGLNYLTLDRTAPTLSGGESQRIRLAGQIGCGLVDVVYILDEPSIGLHPRDNQMLLNSLCDLRDQGNTVIVVEHDEETMRAADHIIDFGPGPGVRGGRVVAEGSVDAVERAADSVTGQYLSGRRTIRIPDQMRPGNGHRLTIHGATHHNLKDVTVDIPLGKFVCVTGVSGSGKSSLVNDILWQVLNRDLNRGEGQPGRHDKVTGLEHLDKAIDIDQSPIGRTPRSNPATYVKLFDLIRDLYTKLPEARVRGYKAGRFSFNVSGGRCEACEGHGATKLEMDFLADIWITCPVCNSQRFNHETLEVRFKGRSIAQVLDMDVQEALEHFESLPKIRTLLQTLHDVGLDYLKLGQPSPTLSGGEAQRIKLARELGKRSTGRTIYLLDEPTTGLHFADVEKLLEVLHGFVDAGNTVLVVEHSLDVIKTADWLIDIGPEGGAGGGTVVCCGTPQEVAACETSHTGRALRSVIRGPWSTARGRKKASVAAINNGRQTTNNGQPRSITIRGAAQHNLQHIDVTIPRGQMNVFCGPSGSGKTSLAMETLYAEGQRRYVESLSAYARQFLGQMPKPKVEHIHGLQPSIAIEQKTTGSTPRSTVGTVTEIYDYLRILWCRLGTQHCPECRTPVNTQTTDEVIERLMNLEEGTKLLLLAPQEVKVGQVYARLWDSLRDQGFARVRVDGTTYRLEDVPDIDRKRKHQVEVVVDRLTIQKSKRSRIADSVEAALSLGQGLLRAAFVDDDRPEPEWRVEAFSLHRVCESCGRSFEELTPNNFSFNSPLGWCHDCEGMGSQQGTDLGVLISDPQRSLLEAAVSIWPDPATSPVFESMLHAMSASLGFRLDVPFSQLDPLHRRAVLYGAGDRWFVVPATTAAGKVAARPGFRFQFHGLFPSLEEAARVSYAHRQKLMEVVGQRPCPTCDGSRLRDDAANVRFQNLTLQQISDLPLDQALEFLKTVKLSSSQKKIAGDLLHEARSRLSFLVEVGLDYLALSRSLPTLSGGETQRIRLSGQIGRALTGVLYVLDEPTIGLHPRDNARLIAALHRLRDLGNTLVLVEHDKEVITSADRLYDFGPGAGRYGGTITAEGSPREVAQQDTSLTGEFLSRRREIVVPLSRRTEDRSVLRWLELTGARLHNLRNAELKIPLGTFTCVTGVSGSGKSSLVEDTLARALSRQLHRSSEQPGPFDELRGLEHLDKVIIVDQQPLGTTPKSNPGTYVGVFDHIRELFAKLPDARVRGYAPGRFSFNRPGGRCEACEGDGQKKIEMHFLPDVWVECDECRGQRYNRETLSVLYRGHSIADVLNLSISQCLELFANIPKIRKPLATLDAIGLGYLTLGQSATTLSGGEAQRVKLAAELARPHTGKTIYILDEPTTGLHFDDIDKLLKVLNSLVEAGNTVVVIEHNLDVIKTADWVIDLGPEAGRSGGWIVAQGTPEELVAHAEAWSVQSRLKPKRGASEPIALRSHTGEQLAPVLKASRRGERAIFDAAAEGKKRSGDVSLAEVGREARMPWEVDGRKWHTQDRIAHSGKPCRWEGAALNVVIDFLESAPSPEPSAEPVVPRRKKAASRVALMRGSDLLRQQQQPGNAVESSAKDSEGSSPETSVTSGLKTIWNDQSTVEVTGANQRQGWFMHALTRDEWLLKLTFRVAKGTFDQDELTKRLGLKDINDLNELPIYNRSERVRVKNQRGAFQEVSITVHWLREVDTPAFRQFLTEARASYQSRVEQAPSDPAEAEPWKVLGRKWHLMSKGFPADKRPKWKLEVLEALFEVMDAITDGDSVIWNERQFVRYRRPDAKKEDWAVIVTKRRAGVDLVVTPAREGTGIGSVAGIVTEHESLVTKSGRTAYRLRFLTLTQVRSPELKDFLRRCR